MYVKGRIDSLCEILVYLFLHSLYSFTISLLFRPFSLLGPPFLDEKIHPTSLVRSDYSTSPARFIDTPLVRSSSQSLPSLRTPPSSEPVLRSHRPRCIWVRPHPPPSTSVHHQRGRVQYDPTQCPCYVDNETRFNTRPLQR